jgi:hypothetical protein
VLRVLDLPQSVAMVAEASHVVIHQQDNGEWEYPLGVAEKLGWKDRVAIVRVSL